MLKNDRQKRGAELLRLVFHHPAVNQQQQDRAVLLDRHALEDDPPLPDLKAVISALQIELLDFVPISSAAHPESLIEPLTERELEVLRLIGQGLSNPAIADRLVISVGTVKAHTNRIYGKLAVTNRVEAVTRARVLALLIDSP
jgi:ATP/maltotriose-dependent transcriptional regulator MalT